ncbi:hypothetical protein P0W64_01590 [Tsukamurella sp. 8F]|uniref:hypothetical protein n=1 Tax=unclassified Tsukamurella TaxID=2633480 RepID=UPI0023B9232E|nr:MULTISPECIES: hypothetical protein [unclassified Tsukamurella]MDF0531069.1 hypothetical protein [Tsukamurella sp. 8J]MDF0585464.1 hypothetical protein [Tsukamurella sp. 8F]
MTTHQTPTATPTLVLDEARALPGALRRSLRHRGTRPSDDLVLVSQWRAGPASDHAGPFLTSLTRFTPKHTRDLPGIWLAGIRLADQLIRLDGAVGVATYIRPGRRSIEVGSLSVWTDEAALGAFVSLPYHVVIMDRYRPRGLPVHSATWWSDAPTDVTKEVEDGLRLLDSSNERRVTQRPR